MKTIQTTSRTGADGTLTLTLPSGMPDTDLDVLVVLQPKRSNSVRLTVDQQEWTEVRPPNGRMHRRPNLLLAPTEQD